MRTRVRGGGIRSGVRSGVGVVVDVVGGVGGGGGWGRRCVCLGVVQREVCQGALPPLHQELHLLARHDEEVATLDGHHSSSPLTEPKVQAIYWHYLTLRKRVKLNMKILRLDFTHRKQQEIRRVKYKFKFLEGAGNLMQDKFTIIQRNPRKPRALVRLKNDGEVIEGPGEIYLTIQMVAENFDGEVMDTVLIESVLFISEYNF